MSSSKDDLMKEYLKKITEYNEKLGFSFSTPNIVNIGNDFIAKAKKVDESLNDLLKKVPKLDHGYSTFFDNAISKSKDLGIEITNLISLTEKWVAEGHSLNEALKLSEISNLYSGLHGLNDTEAIAQLTAAMKLFNLDAQGAMQIVDALTAVSNKYSISVSDLAASLGTISAMDTYSSNLHQTLAMAAGIDKFSESSVDAGVTLKNLEQTIQGMTTGMAKSLAFLTDNKISIFENQDTGELKSTYEIMLSIASVWDSLTKSNQKEVLTILSPKSDLDNTKGLIEGMSTGHVQEALSDSLRSGGTALLEDASQIETLADKTQKFDAAVESLANTAVSTGLLGFFTDLSTTGIRALDGLISKVGLLPPLLVAVAGGLSATKNVGRLQYTAEFSYQYA